MNTLVNLLIFSLPFGAVLRITPVSNVSIYPYDLIAGSIFLLFLYKVVVRKESMGEKKIFVMFGIFLIVGFISLLINSKFLTLENFFVSFAYLIRYAFYVSIIFAFQFLDKKFKESVGNKLIISGAMFALAGFVQYFFYPNLRNLYYLGWDEHLYRLFSTFLDPNFAGTFLVLGLILLSDKIIRSLKDKSKLVPLSILWVAILVAILLTYSRSAFIMLIVGIGTLLGLHRFYKVIAVGLVLFVGLFVLFSNRDIEGLNPFRTASVETRVESMNEAIDIFSKNAIIGVGFNVYRYAQVRYGFRTEQGSLTSNADAGTDNSYLFVLVTTGVLGFIIFVDIWINIIRNIVRNLNSEPYAKVALASIGGLLVNTIFINSLFYAPIMAWTFILVGITGSRKR